MKRRTSAKRIRRLPADATARLNRIGIALSRERDLDRLLALILRSARDLVGCDAGSLYLVQRRPGAAPVRDDFLADKELYFKLAQNDSVSFPFRATPLPITPASIAGYVALTNKPLVLRDAYRIPASAPYRFGRSFDDATGYRTVSMLSVPMANQKGEILGVLQLINRRRTRRPLGRNVSPARVLPFDRAATDLAASLASQAGVAIENNLLYREIRDLFDVFVRASVSAIESRDPTTAGHSARVARLTTALARAVHAARAGPYARVRFTEEEIRQIEYASLLHDFGKIGVREAILVKAKKLFPEELAVIEERAREIRLGLRLACLQRKLDALNGGADAPEEAWRRLEDDLARQIAQVEADIALVRRANEPSLLDGDAPERIEALARRTYAFPGCDVLSLLSDREAQRLGIRRGSLSPEERRQIESHVTQSYEYLRRITWPRDLARVPDIAYAHHEKMNGRGYPRGLAGKAIPLESRMMTIADIYDALTAADRPYKKAVPQEKALAILADEAAQGALDGELLRLFAENGVYRAAAEPERLTAPAGPS